MSVAFRSGRTCECVATSLPLVEKDMIRRGLIRYNIDIFQLGYRPGGTAASKGTHDAGGCVDVAQRSPEFIKVWRRWGWTMQDRSAAFPTEQHAHGWPYKCPHLSAGAELQEGDWDRKDAGLVGTGTVGGLWPIDDWKTAMKKRLAEIKIDEENSMPTTAEVTAAVVKALTNDKAFRAAIAADVKDAVLNADEVPNTVTGNPDNANVTPVTNWSQVGKKVTSIEAKVDALAAAVAAATFPKPPAA